MLPNNGGIVNEQQHDGGFGSDPGDEEDVCCAKCEERPEDVLILTCDHNLCLNCASKNLYEQ